MYRWLCSCKIGHTQLYIIVSTFSPTFCPTPVTRKPFKLKFYVLIKQREQSKKNQLTF